MKKGSMMGKAEGISRRNFVTGAVLAGSLAAAGIAGCAPQNSAAQAGAPTGSSSTEKDDPWAIEELGEPSETISCDLCVVGGGGTGLAAGIQAQQLGVDVVVLEKKNSTGGSFIGSEGLFAVGSHWQDDAGVSSTSLPKRALTIITGSLILLCTRISSSTLPIRSYGSKTSGLSSTTCKASETLLMRGTSTRALARKARALRS